MIRFNASTLRLWMVASGLALGLSVACGETAAVFLTESSGNDPDWARAVAGEIEAAGYSTEFIGPDVLTNSAVLLPRKFDLLVLPHARSLPVASMNPVRNYLRGGGRLMALGLPAWESATVSFAGKLISSQDYQRILEGVTADKVIIDFARGDFSRFTSSTDAESAKMQTQILDDDGQKVLHAAIVNLGGWSVLDGPQLRDPFADGRSLTCFRARGGRNTSEMALEWDEQDGSRWIATITLDPGWQSYCLPPEAFHFWKSTAGRGGPGDHFNVRQAARLSIGLARSHNALPWTPHEYWMSSIGTAPSPLTGVLQPESAGAPPLDTLSPAWKFYPMSGPLKVNTPEGLAFAASLQLQPPNRPQAMQPRPCGVGFNQERPWRWQPLLEARSPQGDYRGALATLLIAFAGEFRGGIRACFTPEDAAFYNQPGARQLLRQTAAVMRRGLFLQEGGAEFFTVFDGQKFMLGARAVNLGHNSQTNLTLRVSVKSKQGGTNLFAQEWVFTLPAGGNRTAQQEWRPLHWPHGGLVVTAELAQNGIVIDRLEHELNVWRPPAEPQFVQEHDGGFWLGGRPWKVNGVNYMPAAGIGVSEGDYFEYWLGKGAYDPEAIGRDLRRIKAMNLNAVSIFVYHSELRAQHLLDFLRRCQELGLHVNQSLRPGTPLDFQWAQMKELIEYYHMAENDTIFAYDLAWEAEHQDQQNSYGHDWTAWVLQRYGSFNQAEKAWGQPWKMPAVPPLADLARDGPWRVLAADYRAFLDDEIAQKYGEARRLVRSIDPHHAVSFRMSEAGDPTLNSEERLPFDFYGLARAVDIWEPEAYGRIGDWNQVRAGRFEADYARLCDPQKPLLWAEMGNTVWDEHREDASTAKLEFTASFYRDFYRMMGQSGSDGVFFWWYPGGLRVNEQSDFGIINPDGTERPVTRVIHEEGPRFLEAAKPPAPDYFITVNRDRDARGLFGIYQAVKKDYWQAVAEGKTPALRWDKKPGQK